MPAKLEITGSVFNKLTAIKRAGSSKHGHCQWEFLCECGNVKVLTASLVKSSAIKSCGCLNGGSHGESVAGNRSTEYNIWSGMRSRCAGVTARYRKDYFDRGIRVCDRWLHPTEGFANFVSDMGRRPSKAHSLDRINNDGNYAPDNCRWATHKVQMNNRRKRQMYCPHCKEFLW